MKIKIKSKKIKNKFIYGDILENKKATTLVIFLSGFSGSQHLPLFKSAAQIFFKNGFSTLRFNFCNDSDDTHKEILSIKMQELSFQIYIAEMKNIIDTFSDKYSNIVIVGHSFGTVIALLFLNKFKKKDNLVLWEPTLLPWKKEWMEEDFIFNDRKKLYIGKEKDEILNKTFYKELIRVDTVSLLKSLSQKTCIIAVEKSADKDAKKYFSKLKNKKFSELLIIKKSNHLFSGKHVQKILFKKTLDFLEIK